MSPTMNAVSEDLTDDLAAIFAGDPRALADPYPVYRRLREEAPVLRLGKIVVVSTYRRVQDVLRDPVTFSSRRFAGDRLDATQALMDAEQLDKLRQLVEHQSLWIAMLDQPGHTRVRSLANKAFTKPRVEKLRSGVHEIVEELLAGPDAAGEIDLVSQLSFPLPLRVITTLLGASTERAEDIRAWSNEIARAIGTEYANVDDAYAALQGFRTYVVTLVQQLRDSDRTDLFAQLAAANADGERLTEDELVAMCVLLLFAGHETTTNLITNAIVALLRNPEQLALLQEDPTRTTKAVEEFLRYNTSNQAVHRVVMAETEIGGVPVNVGDTVRLMQGAANHDEEMFADGDRLDVLRDNAARHIGFGFGIHTCLGSWVARMETDIAVRTMITRYPHMEIAGDITYTPNFLIYGPDEVHLRLNG